SDSRVWVADATSSAALCSESFEMAPLASESPADLSEFPQVLIAEQTPSAQSAADVDWLLLEPHAVARRGTRSTTATKGSRFTHRTYQPQQSIHARRLGPPFAL